MTRSAHYSVLFARTRVILLLFLIFSQATAFYFATQRLATPLEPTTTARIPLRRQLLQAGRSAQKIGPMYRKAESPHVSIDKVPAYVPLDDLMFLLGEPRVDFLHGSAPLKHGHFHGGKVFVTCSDVQAAEKLLNTPASMLGPSRDEQVIIRPEKCAYNETRMVHLSGLPSDSTVHTVRGLASNFGKVSRLVLYRMRRPARDPKAPPALFSNGPVRLTPQPAAIVVFETPQDAMNMSSHPQISFRRCNVRAGLVCNDYQLHPYDIIHSTEEASKMRVSLTGVPRNWTEQEVTNRLTKYGIEVTDVKLGLEAILVDGTILQSGRATAGVRTFAMVQKAAFLINNQTEGFDISGIPPPDGNIFPYVIHNIPGDDKISRNDWLDHFVKQDIDTVCRVQTVAHGNNTRDLTFDVASLRDAPAIAKLNGTTINGFKLDVQRRRIVEEIRFYTKARENFAKTYSVGPFELDGFNYIFPHEAARAARQAATATSEAAGSEAAAVPETNEKQQKSPATQKVNEPS